MRNRRNPTIFTLALSVLLLLVFVYLHNRPGAQESEAIAEKVKQGALPKGTPDRRDLRSLYESQSAGVFKPLKDSPGAEWINRAAKKRDSASPMPPDILFREGLGLVQIGEYRQARVSFQKLINRHPGSPLIPYAFLGIAEAYRLEDGGRDNLQQAGIQYRDFLVFFPNSELAPYARNRLAELEAFIKARHSRPTEP